MHIPYICEQTVWPIMPATTCNVHKISYLIISQEINCGLIVPIGLVVYSYDQMYVKGQLLVSLINDHTLNSADLFC